VILAIPHFIFLLLWTIAVFFASIVNWIATLSRAAAGRPHNFMCKYVRYAAHLTPT